MSYRTNYVSNINVGFWMGAIAFVCIAGFFPYFSCVYGDMMYRRPIVGVVRSSPATGSYTRIAGAGSTSFGLSVKLLEADDVVRTNAGSPVAFITCESTACASLVADDVVRFDCRFDPAMFTPNVVSCKFVRLEQYGALTSTKTGGL